MNDIWLFLLGTAVFGAYLVGLMSMINKQHKIQARQDVKNVEERSKKMN